VRSESGKIGVGVIGCGYWGPNLVRNFYQGRGSRVVSVADLDEKRLAFIQEMYPSVGITPDYTRILEDDAVEAVVIATPVQHHARITVQALEAGKHVLVEKPMASSATECEAMMTAADKAGRVLMVGHTFEFTDPVRRMKTILDEGMLGKLYYVNSQRLNLGLFRNDVNVVWDLAPHDISILLHMTGGKMPLAVQATGAAHINPKVEDVATLTLEFNDGLIAFVQCSWLDPRKVRQTTLVGSKKMLVYNDIEPTEKIWLYDRGVDGPASYQHFDEFPYTYRYGDITIPKVGGAEPLRTQAQHFLDCVENGKKPLTDGASGLRVVRILEASSQSLRNNGARIAL
jgi:predicted dehydrogenase